MGSLPNQDTKEALTLSNICEGALEEEFQSLYPAILSQLKEGDKGSISITVEMARVKDTSSMVTTSFKVTPKFPARKRAMVGQIAKGKLFAEKVAPKVRQMTLLDRDEGEAVNE